MTCSPRSGPCGDFSAAPLASTLCWLSLSFMLVGVAMVLFTIAVWLLAKHEVPRLWLKALCALRRRRVRLLCKTPKSSRRERFTETKLGMSTVTERSRSSSTFLQIALLAAFLPLVSGCSTTPSVMPQPLPPVPEANLLRCPNLPFQVQAGSMEEMGALLIVVSGRFYECQSLHDDLIAVVRKRNEAIK